MPEQPLSHQDQGPTEPLQEGAARIELTPEEQDEQKNRKATLVFRFKYENIDTALEFLEAFPLPDDVRNSPELQDAVQARWVNLFQAGDIRNARKLLEAFPLLQEMVQDVVKESLVRFFRHGYTRNALQLLEAFPLPQEMVHDAVKKELVRWLQAGDTRNALELLEAFPLPQEMVQNAVKETLVNLLQDGYITNALKLLEEFPLPQEMVHDAVKGRLVYLLHDRKIPNALELLKAFPLPDDVRNSPEVQNVVKKVLVSLLRDRLIPQALKFLKEFPLPDDVRNSPEVQDVAKKGLVSLLQGGQTDEALELLEAFNIPRDEKLSVVLQYSNIREIEVTQEKFEQSEHPDPYMQHARDFYDDDRVPLAVRRSGEVRNHVYNSVFDAARDRVVDTAALSARVSHALSPQEYLAIAQAQPDALPLGEKGKADTKLLATELERLLRASGDANIADMLRLGIDHFGADAMLRYMNRPDLSRHDALHFLPSVIKLQAISGLPTEQFSENILTQVARDGAGYAEGTAHHHFFAVAGALKARPPADILAVVKKYKNIKQLQTLAADLGADPFGSWKNLKKLYEISQLLNRTKILEELNEGAVPPQLRAYIETLAFHPNISTSAVMQLWKEPAAFLDVDDAHTPEEVNRVKKPTNLISLPHLGLTAEDLRDALVNGELDRMQVLPPMEYQHFLGVPSREQSEESAALYHVLRAALGERAKGVKGVAVNAPKLFSEVKKWCAQHKIAWKDFWNPDEGPAILSKLASDAQEALRDSIYHNEFGIRGAQETFQRYRVRLGQKSDPSMVVAGNDTASCMPFGSGKNNAYMFNPVYAQMVVERLNEEGKWRTAAQSVLSLDHETSTPTPELMKAYLKEGKHIKDLVKPGDLERLPVVTCDNIEIAKNEEGSRVRNLREMYQKFFTAYLAQHAEALRVNRTKVAVGTGYTPKDIGFRSIDNRYIPTAPAGYSDNVHAQCLEIETGLPAMEEGKRMEVAPLTTRDAVSSAVLEGKAYSDNVNLLENLHKMQNNLIGMEIANSHFGRANLSFLYRDRNGSPRGYLLAYEGVQGDQPFVYLDDLATDREGDAKSGGLLIKKFFEAYVAAYGKENKPYLPLFTNAREKTSYPLLRHAKRFAQRYGLLARVMELGTHERGDDRMHDVVIVIGKTEEELARQEEQMRAAFEAGGEGYNEGGDRDDNKDEDW